MRLNEIGHALEPRTCHREATGGSNGEELRASEKQCALEIAKTLEPNMMKVSVIGE
jgi:hypothetical protein